MHQWLHLPSNYFNLNRSKIISKDYGNSQIHNHIRSIIEMASSSRGCTILAKCNNIEDINDHLLEYCCECTSARFDDAADGDEFLFADGPPSWIAEEMRLKSIEEEEKKKNEEINKKRERIANKRKLNENENEIKRTDTMEEKEAKIRAMAGHTSDGMLEYQLRQNLHLDKETAAKKRIEMKREAAMKKKEENKKNIECSSSQNESQSIQKPFNTKPWQPSVPFLLKDKRRSILNESEQKRYVSICANFLKAEVLLRFTGNKDELNFFDDKLQGERDIINGIVAESFNKSIQLTGRNRDALDFMISRYQIRYPTEHHKYSFHSSIDWKWDDHLLSSSSSSSSSGSIIKPFLERVLIAAEPSIITLPNLQNKVVVHLNEKMCHPANKKYIPIETDQNLRNMCMDNGVSIGMEATTAVHLMTRSIEPYGYSFNVPVTVTEHVNNGQLIRVCVVGKPRPEGQMSGLTLSQLNSKYRVKTTFIQMKNEKKDEKREVTPPPIPTSDISAETSTPIDNILGMMGSSSVPTPKKSSSTHSYSLFSITDGNKQCKLIIRSTPGSRNKDMNAVLSISTKLEFVPEAGAQKMSYEEMLRNSMKAVFKNADQYALFHLHPIIEDCFQISYHRPIPHSNQFNQGFHKLISSRSCRFRSLIDQLTDLPIGEYILQVSPTSDKMNILKQNPTGNDILTSLHPRVKSPMIEPKLEMFHGIDERRVLRWQTMQSRVPCSFFPSDHWMLKINFNKQKKGGSPEKKKKKNKAGKRKTGRNDMNESIEEQV